MHTSRNILKQVFLDCIVDSRLEIQKRVKTDYFIALRLISSSRKHNIEYKKIAVLACLKSELYHLVFHKLLMVAIIKSNMADNGPISEPCYYFVFLYDPDNQLKAK